MAWVVGSARRGPWAVAPGPTAWLHAASIGEAKGLVALLRFLPTGFPLTLTATTRAGMERLARTGHPAFLLPLDEPVSVERFLDQRRVAVAVFLESEAWPCALQALQRRSVPVAFAALRCSRASMERWRRFTRLFPGWTRTVDQVWTDSVTYVGAVERLGFARVAAGTSLKWAGHPPAPPTLREAPLSAAVSFHLRDLASVVQLARSRPRDGWLWFPRRPHRVRLHRLAARLAGLYTVETTPGPGQVRISTTFGETGPWLSRARFCWVAPGHDVEEAHRMGVPEVWTGRVPRRTSPPGTSPDVVAVRIAEWIRLRSGLDAAYYNGSGHTAKADTIGNEP